MYTVQCRKTVCCPRLKSRNKILILDTFLHQENFKDFINQMWNTLGADATEQACESECHVLIKADNLLQFSCPLVCKR